MREINYLVGAQSITPSSVQEAGFQCEYNATKVIFTLEESLAEKLASQTDRQLWTVEVGDAEGNIKVYPVELESGKVEFILPAEITLSGSTASLQLVVTTVDENYIMLKRQCFSVVKIKFGQSVATLVDSNEYDRYAHNLVGAMSLAVDAAQVATQSAELSQTASQKAIEAINRAEAAVKEEWQLYKEIVLGNSVSAFSEQVELLGDTTKGVRVKVILPANTVFPNNRLSFIVNLNLNRQIIVRGESWLTNESVTSCCVDIVPRADIWNVEVAPYIKALGDITGDISYSSGDKVRYVKLQTNSTNPVPAGTKIIIWGLQ